MIYVDNMQERYVCMRDGLLHIILSTYTIYSQYIAMLSRYIIDTQESYVRMRDSVGQTPTHMGMEWFWLVGSSKL